MSTYESLRNLTVKAIQDPLLVEIRSFFAGVEFEYGVEIGDVNGDGTFNSEILGEVQAKELLGGKRLDVGGGVETVSLGSTDQTNSL